MEIFVRTRKLTMRQLEEVSKWLDVHPKAKVSIRGAPHRKFIQQYIAEHDGNRPIHQLKVSFWDETDARHFMLDWA